MYLKSSVLDSFVSHLTMKTNIIVLDDWKHDCDNSLSDLVFCFIIY